MPRDYCAIRRWTTWQPPGAADDDDWEARISAHVARRPPGWHTVEPADLPAVLRAASGVPMLVDDIATWLTGELDDAGAWEGDPQTAAGLPRAVR